MSSREADDYLRKVIELSERMIELAYAGDACRKDAGCGIVFGSLRDKAYKIRKLAEAELDKHEDTGGAEAAAPGAQDTEETH